MEQYTAVTIFWTASLIMLFIFLERGTNCVIPAVWAVGLQILACMKCTGISPLTHTHTYIHTIHHQAGSFPALFSAVISFCIFWNAQNITASLNSLHRSSSMATCHYCSSVVKFTFHGVVLLHQLNLEDFLCIVFTLGSVCTALMVSLFCMHF